MEGQVREWGQEDSGGRCHSPGQAPGGDRCPLHVPEHQGQQVATTYQGLSHREISHISPKILHFPGTQLDVVNRFH